MEGSSTSSLYPNNKDEPVVVTRRLPNTRAHTILNDCLYLGPAQSATNESAIKADGITHILNITKEIPKQQYPNIQICQLECYDSPQQQLPFEEAATFIDSCLNNTNKDDKNSCSSAKVYGNNKCLVHCNAGQSRSASIIIYYLMTKGNTLQQSYQYVKARKPDIRPNYGFCSQLQGMEQTIFGQGVCTLGMNEYKADTICELLEGSEKTREDVLNALDKFGGDGELALGMLLE